MPGRSATDGSRDSQADSASKSNVNSTAQRAPPGQPRRCKSTSAISTIRLGPAAGPVKLATRRPVTMVESMTTNRPLRSLLFVPGNQPSKVAKVATFGADAVILDLEDAVPLAEKESTRPMVRAALPTLQPGPLRYVRVNAMDTGLTRGDLEAVVCSDLDGVKLPKAESPDDVQQVETMLSEIEQ